MQSISSSVGTCAFATDADAPLHEDTLEERASSSPALVDAIGEMEAFVSCAGLVSLPFNARTPFAELPSTAAFLGAIVAQETIKMITK